MLLYWAVAQKWPAQEIYISCTQLVGGCALDMAVCMYIMSHKNDYAAAERNSLSV